MTFNSFLFLLFFPAVVSVYFFMPQKWRWLWLLLASCCFYMAFIPAYILVLFLLILVDYTAALWIEKLQGQKRKIALLVSILSTCAVLFIFKYFDFINTSVAWIAHHFGWNYSIKNLLLILPLGLSFHTFQSLGYVIDVYRGRQKAQRHLGVYALYVMFFPQLVAGPIERAAHLLPQFFCKHEFNAKRVTSGLQLMLWGMFQKVVIADRLAILVNRVYANPSDFSVSSLIIATVFFAFQIYCDFSGYSDIAIGAAEVMGFKLMKNFERPYLATSIGDFWHRWHISLSTWFRDYLYIPLGGKNVGAWRWCFNIFITFVVSGMWHGANWTFVIWGALHGFYYLFSKATQTLRARFTRALGLARIPALHKIFQVIITFVLVCFAWIFFRASTFDDAVFIVSQLFIGWGKTQNLGSQGQPDIGLTVHEFIFAVSLIVFLLWVNVLEQKENIRFILGRCHIFVRWGVYTALVLLIMNFGVDVAIPFIYFQF